MGDNHPACASCGCSTIICCAFHQDVVKQKVTADRARIAAAIREEIGHALLDHLSEAECVEGCPCRLASAELARRVTDRLLRVVEG